MPQITKKLIKYFTLIITFIVVLLFCVSSVFISKVYTTLQYNDLKDSAKNIYNQLAASSFDTSKDFQNIDTSVISVFIKGNTIYPISYGNSPMMSNTGRIGGMHGMGMRRMNFLQNIDYTSLHKKGTLKNPMGEEFLYYSYKAHIGNVITLQSNKFSSNYLSIIYIVLFIVFILGILVSIPLIAYVGKQFTKPILMIQNAAHDIADGKFDINVAVKTNDEIQALAESVENMSLSLKKKHELQRNFIANVSHDFKTPLSIIRNYSEAIKDGIIVENNIKEYSKEMISEVDRLNRLVMELLELSKFQSNGYTLKKEPTLLKELIVSSVEKLRPLGHAKNISIIEKLDSIGEELIISLDPIQISRVLYNLIDNAIKFSEDGGKIEVQASIIENSLQISVKDNGIGIDSSMLEDIWNRYYKHSKSGGMGLGLAICSEILNLHNFEYGAESDNTETIFYFYIPLNSGIQSIE